MQIIQKIAAWAAEQPAWVEDTIRRLMTGGLTPDDLQELAALAKSEYGLPNPDGRVAVQIDPKTLAAPLERAKP